MAIIFVLSLSRLPFFKIMSAQTGCINENIQHYATAANRKSLPCHDFEQSSFTMKACSSTVSSMCYFTKAVVLHTSLTFGLEFVEGWKGVDYHICKQN